LAALFVDVEFDFLFSVRALYCVDNLGIPPGAKASSKVPSSFLERDFAGFCSCLPSLMFRSWLEVFVVLLKELMLVGMFGSSESES
jgi:hypothetical protein